MLKKAGALGVGIETRLFAGIALAIGAVVAVSLAWPEPPSATAAPAAEAPQTPAISTTEPDAAFASPQAVAMTVTHRLVTVQDEARVATLPSGDPDDLASYFRPGDPVPSTANLIRALNEAGVRTGIAAFNPPGTSPPLEGLAVPADFALPPGYVRHHQVTDEGVPIEPILMFSPDLELRDAQGRPIALPENRVVPPELAPPGMPRRWVRPGGP